MKTPTPTRNSATFPHRLASWAMLLCLPAVAALAVPATGGERDGGALVRNFQKLNEEFNRKQAVALQMSASTEATAGRDRLNAMSEALGEGDDAKAADLYASEMSAGRGPLFWHGQREDYARREIEFLDLFDRIKNIWQEARRARKDDEASATSSPLDDLAQTLPADRGATSRIREKLTAAKQQREEKLRSLLSYYPHAGIYQAESVAGLPLDVVEDILLDVADKVVEMGDAAASAQRAESFMKSFPDTVRARHKEKQEGQLAANPEVPKTRLF